MDYQNTPTSQDHYRKARARYNKTLVPRHDSSKRKGLALKIAFGVGGALAVVGGVTFFLIKRKAKPMQQSGIRAANSVTVMKLAEELYAYWRRLENLPSVMSHLETVQETDSTHSHWVAKAPLGTKVEWDAEITEDIPNQKIAWRSLAGSQVPNEGYVEFDSASEGQSTVVHVSLSYMPPGGPLSAGVAKLLGQEPNQQIAEDMQKFRQTMESGEGSSVVAG